MIERRLDENDRRVRQIVLTERSRLIFEEMRASAADVRTGADGSIPGRVPRDLQFAEKDMLQSVRQRLPSHGTSTGRSNRPTPRRLPEVSAAAKAKKKSEIKPAPCPGQPGAIRRSIGGIFMPRRPRRRGTAAISS
ncbi:hypothetical protein WH297_15400 [Ochrobactrum vermis]|uniref:HTH marR-type domain-containing protein n=1 Tax=Ochrobactrum vermis TaxID=1827297 RepID=A0ABU8PGD4_9HYPH